MHQSHRRSSVNVNEPVTFTPPSCRPIEERIPERRRCVGSAAPCPMQTSRVIGVPVGEWRPRLRQGMPTPTNLCRVRRMKKLLLLLIVLAIAGVAARQLTSS